MGARFPHLSPPKMHSLGDAFTQTRVLLMVRYYFDWLGPHHRRNDETRRCGLKPGGARTRCSSRLLSPDPSSHSLWEECV